MIQQPICSASTSYDDSLDLPEILLPGSSSLTPVQPQNSKESAILDYVTKLNSGSSEDPESLKASTFSEVSTSSSSGALELSKTSLYSESSSYTSGPLKTTEFPDSLTSLFSTPGPLGSYSHSSISASEVSDAVKTSQTSSSFFKAPETVKNLKTSTYSYPSSSTFASPESESQKPSTSSGIFKESKRTARPTECVVCGNPANGYHYDVASCNGCKTFFRRICLSEKNFECKANKDCFDLNRRKTPLKCRACRHQKCVAVGMNPLAMELDEKEASSSNFKKLLKRTVIKEEEPDEDDDCQVLEVLKPRQPKNVIKVVETLENRLQKCIDGLVYLESKIEKFRKSSYNPHWSEITGIEFLLQTESRMAYADRYEAMPNWPLPPHLLPPPKLGEPKCFPQRKDFPPPKHRSDRRNWLFYNLMTTVEYAKTFAFFNNLTSKDKLILTKYVTLACMNLHVSYTSVVKKFEEPIHPDGSGTPYFDENHYGAMVMSVAPLIRCQIQSVEYLLLKAICLCNPAVPDLSSDAQSIIAVAREKFADALFDHCLRNRSDGPAHFAQLIQIIDVLERQQRMQKDIHLLFVAPRLAKLPKECAIRVIEDIMDN